MEMTLEDELTNLSDDCSTLLLPALSIGNVGQLAVDILVSSSGAKRVAFLDEPSVLPCVGNDAYGPIPEGILALPLEAYESPQHSLTLIQQRSPVLKCYTTGESDSCLHIDFDASTSNGQRFIRRYKLHYPSMHLVSVSCKGMMVEFAKNFARFISSIKKKHVLILSSLDSGRRKIFDPSSIQIHYLSSSTDDGTDKSCEELGFKKLQEYNPSQRRWKHLADLAVGNTIPEDELDVEDELVDDDYYAGLPFAALFSCCKAEGVKVTCLLCYCSEGDNTRDSFQLADAACKLLGLSPENFNGNEPGGWTIPLSWMSVYGPPPDVSMF